jgi:hypothetical protein
LPISLSPRAAWDILAWLGILFVLAHAFIWLRTQGSFFNLVKLVYGFDTLVMPLIGAVAGGCGLYVCLRGQGSRWLRRVSLFVLGCSILAPSVRFYAGHVEAHWLVVRRVVIETPKVTQPVRILHVSDIQSDAVGKYEERVFARIRELRPDLIVHTGDLLQPVRPATLASEWPKIAALLRTLNPPGGVFHVMGDVDGWMNPEILAGAGPLRLLSAQETTVTQPGARLRIYGLAQEQDMRWFQSRAAIAQWRRKAAPDEFTILLGHHPDYVMGISDVPVDLCLAGHTHGGQIRIPFVGPIVTLSYVPRSWARGFRKVGVTRLNVSAGIGCEHASQLPSMRLFCPPEMTLIELRPAPTPAPNP